MSFKDYREFTFYKENMESIEIEDVDESWALKLLNEEERNSIPMPNNEPVLKSVKTTYASALAERMAPHVATLEKRAKLLEVKARPEPERVEADEIIEVCPSVLSLTAIEKQLFDQIQEREDRIVDRPQVEPKTLERDLTAKPSFWRAFFSRQR